MFGRVAVIIVNWNNRADTLDCLASLREDSYTNKTVILVDNGSTDGAGDAVRAGFPEVTVLEMGRNLGFTGGNNAGIHAALAAGADYLFLLNNDTTVEPDAITQLVAALDAHPQFGLLTPVIHHHDEPDRAWFSGSVLALEEGIAVHDNRRVPHRSEPPFEIPWASGCAMLIRAELMRQLNGFDDRFFLIWEDVDLCIRVREAGAAVGIVPAARIYHRVSSTFRKLSHLERYYHVRNNLLVVLRLGGRRYVRAALRIMVRDVRQSLGAIRRRKTLKDSDLGITIRAFVHHLAGRYGAMH
jgi:GT2 family glycosyltransferase